MVLAANPDGCAIPPPFAAARTAFPSSARHARWTILLAGPVSIHPRQPGQVQSRQTVVKHGG